MLLKSVLASLLLGHVCAGLGLNSDGYVVTRSRYPDYFKYHDVNLTFREAIDYCLDRGEHIVMFDSAYQQSVIMRALNLAKDAWIGVKLFNTRSGLRYDLLNRRGLSYNSWSVRDPTWRWIYKEAKCPTDCCAVYLTGDDVWRDAECNTKRGVICKTSTSPDLRSRVKLSKSDLEATNLKFDLLRNDIEALKKLFLVMLTKNNTENLV